MPKVVSVLEELEDFATRFDSESSELSTLQLAIRRLEAEKLEKVRQKGQTERELEQLEEVWHSETHELLQLIERLTEEQNQLKQVLYAKQTQNERVKIDTPSCESMEEIKLMLRLKEVIDRQKIEIRAVKRQLEQRDVDLDAMQQQSARLAKLNASLKHKHCVSKRQTEQLLSEKVDLELLLQTKDQLIQHMREHISHSSTATGASQPTCGMSVSLMRELTSPTTPPAQLSESQLIERLNTDTKMLVRPNAKSPAPRFTMKELRDLLIERNELQSRLIDLEEELAVYKRAGDDDPPVQGPINREPDEKLYGRNVSDSSEIRTFFSNFLAKLSR